MGKLKNMQQQHEEDTAELERLREKEAALLKRAAREGARTAKIAEAIDHMEHENDSTSMAVQQLQAQMNELQLSKDGSDKAAAEIATKLESLNKVHDQQTNELAAYEGRVEVLLAEKGNLTAEKEGAQREAQALELKIKDLNAAQKESSAQLSVAQMTLEAMNDVLADIQSSAQTLRIDQVLSNVERARSITQAEAKNQEQMS